MIPKKLHLIWIGDKCWTHPSPLGPIRYEDIRPDHYIQTWKDKHPSWEIKIWNNNDLQFKNWRLKDQMFTLYLESKYACVADLMRYEILYENGGVYVDVDSICHQPLDDLLEHKAFAVQESGGIIANAFLGAEKEYSLFNWMIERLLERGDDLLFCGGKRVSGSAAIGPSFLTHAIEKTNSDITILPCSTFMPLNPLSPLTMFTGEKTYAEHLWHSQLVPPIHIDSSLIM